jgi:RalBP1-associated Eps domain-containing protein
MPNLLQNVINGTLTIGPSSTTAEADLLHLESDDNQTNTQTNKYANSCDYTNKRQSQPDVNLTLNLNKPPPPPPTNASTKPKAASHKIVHQFSNDITAIASPPIPTKKVSAGGYTRSGSNSPPSTSVTDGAGAVGPPNSPPAQMAKGHKAGDWNAGNKEWTKFTESPTSNVSSPGPKPVNFDLQRTTQAVVSDPQILHPVPLRVTPVANTDVAGTANDDDANRHFRKIDSLVYAAAQQLGDGQTDTTSPKQAQQQPQYYNVQQRDSLPTDLRPIQRPQPKKPPTKGILPPPPQRESAAVAAAASVTEVLSNTTDMTGSLSLKKEVPPLPPPR